MRHCDIEEREALTPRIWCDSVSYVEAVVANKVMVVHYYEEQNNEDGQQRLIEFNEHIGILARLS